MAVVIILGGGASWLPWGLLGASLVSLGFSSEQFCYLPLALAALAAPALRLKSRRRTWGLVIVAAAVAALQMIMAPLRPADVSPINRVNAYLGVILASSGDKAETLAHLGLPARCAAMSGATWASRHGEILETACPEVMTISSFASSSCFLEPLVAARGLARAAGPSRSCRRRQVIQGSAVPACRLAMSFVTLLSKASPGLRGVHHDVPHRISGGVRVVRTVRTGRILCVRRRCDDDRDRRHSLATTAFGSGISGADRHNWLGSLATLAALGMLPSVFWQLSRDQLSARVGGAAVFGVLLLSAGWLLWTRHEGLTIGALDKVVQERARSLEVGGWALDPWGVRRIYASVGVGPQAEGTRGIERRELDALSGIPTRWRGFQITLLSTRSARTVIASFVESRSGAITRSTGADNCP
jgi:hypothetical protein